MNNPQTTLQWPPPCPVCRVEADGDHKMDCNVLIGLKAQAYPTILDRNGREWYMNMIDKLNEEIKDLKFQLTGKSHGI